jgi:hypothetical protein
MPEQQQPTLQQFYGFYTNKPFWGVAPLDLTQPTIYPDFSSRMSEVVAEFDEQYYTIRVCRDGFIMFASKFQNLDFVHVLEYLNALSVIFESENQKWNFAKFTQIYEINPQHVLPHTMSGTTIKGTNTTKVNNETMNQYNARFLEFYIPLDYKKLNWNERFWTDLIRHTVTADPRIRARAGRVVSLEQLTQINELFKRIVQNYNTITLLAQMTKSVDQYQNGHYDISVIMSWFIIESYIYKLYQTRVLQGLSAIQQELSSSEALKLLQQRKVLSYDFIGDIHKIRIMRNAITHNTFEAKTTDQEARLALAIILHFIRQDIAVDIELKYL